MDKKIYASFISCGVSVLMAAAAFLCSNTANAQFNTGTITLDGTASEAAYVTSGAYSMAWDDTYLYIRYSGGNQDEPVIFHLDVDPQNPVDGGTNTNGPLVGQANWGITPTLPFRSDFQVYWESLFAEYRIDNGTGGWNTPTVITTTDRSNTGTNNREIRILWTWTGATGRPTAFNFFAYANSRVSPGFMFNQTPSENPGGALASPTMNHYWTVSSTANNASITSPFSRKSYESRASVTQGTTNTFWDYTLGNPGSAVTHTLATNLTIQGQLYVVNNHTLVPQNSGGVRTINYGSAAGQTPTLRCDGTINPNNLAGNDLNMIAAFGTTTISGTAANTTFRIFNLTVNNGAIVQAPATGTVELGWQFGTITVNSGGTLNFVNGTGLVNLTNSGASSTVNLTNSGTCTFNNVTNAGTTSGIMNIANNGTASALSFNNLTNNSSNTLRPATTPAVSPITVRGNLVNNGTFTTSNTGLLDVTMTGAGGTTLAAATYQNLTIANTGSLETNASGVTASGAITIASGRTLTINSGSRFITGTNNVTMTGATGTVNGFLRMGGATQPTLTGVATNVTVNNGGFYEHNFTSNVAGTIPSLTWATGSTASLVGYTLSPSAGILGITGQTFSNFTVNCSALANTCNVQLQGVTLTATGTFSVINTNNNIFRLANSGTVTLNVGNFVLSSTNGSSTLNLSNGSTTNVNISGNYNQSQTANAQSLTVSGGGIANINFTNASSTQTFTQSGGSVSVITSGTLNWNFGTGTSSNTVQFLTNANLGTGATTINVIPRAAASVDFQTFVISGSAAFTSENNTRLISANTNATGAFTTTGTNGSVQTTGTRTYTAGTNFTLNGGAAQNSGNGIGQNAVGNLTINNAAGVALTSATTAASLTLTSGVLDIGANNLTISGTTAGAISGASATNYVATSGTGQLRRAIATSIASSTAYAFPVGRGGNYTPATFTFTATDATARNLHVRAVTPRNTNDATVTDYINNRWWETDLSTATGTYTYTSQFTFLAGDVVGTIGNIRLNRWTTGPLFTQDAGSSASGTTLSSGTLSETSGGLAGPAQWVGRVNPAAITYTWNGSQAGGSWSNALNWTPNGTPTNADDVVIPTSGSYTNALNLTTSVSVNNFTVQGDGAFTMSSTGALTINGNLTNSSSATSTFDCASTFTLASTASQTIPAWNFGNLSAGGGPRVLVSSGTIGICGTFTPGAGAYTITGSTVNFNGTGNQTVNAFNFNNLTISGSRTAATVTLASGTVGVAGNFSVTATGTSYTVTGNTVDFNGTGAQTIGAFGSFNNLTVSGNKGTNTVTFGSGTVGIGGTFSITATNAVYSTTGNTIDYTAAGAQTIASFTGFRYNNLSNSGNGARTLTNTPVIVIDGVYTPTSGAITIGTSTIDFGSASSQPIPATLYYNITNTGNGARTWASSGTIDIANNFTPSGGVNTITGSTVRYSSTVAGPFSLTAINTNVAGSSYNNLTIAGSNGTPTVYQVANGVTLGVAGDLTITSGFLRLATGFTSSTVNVLGNFFMNGGNLNLTNSGTVTDVGTLNLFGNATLTAGTIARTSSVANGFVNFIKSTGPQTLSYTGTTISISLGSAFPMNVGDGTTTNTLQLQSNFANGASVLTILNNATVDLGTFVVSGTSFNANSGSTVITANTGGLAATGATGSVQTTSRTYNTGANYVYNGGAAQVTGTGFTGANNLTINNTAGVSLSAAAAVSGTLTFTNGTLSLGANNLTISNTSASAISGASSSNFIITGGTGSLNRAIAASIASSTTYNFPIGLSAGNYSPAAFTFTATSNSFNLLTRVATGTHPQMNSNGTQTDFFANRYFITNTSGTPSTYAYTSAFTFVSGDQQGTAANIKLNRWGGSWSEDAGSSATSTVLSSGSLNETSGSLTATAEWTGRVNPTVTTYTWTGNVDGTWAEPGNWSPNTSVAGPTSIDNVIISSPGSNVLSVTGTHSIVDLTVSGTGNFTIASGATLTVTGALTATTSATPSFDCASTFVISSSTNTTVPAWSYGNLNLTGGDRTLATSGTIGICGNFTRGAGAYTVAGSTVNFNGTGAQTVPVGAYNNLTISQNRGGAAVTLASGTISVGGTFTPSVTNFTNAYSGNTIDFSSASSQDIPVFFYNNITNTGNGARVWASSGTIDINGSFTAGTGTHTITGSTVRYSSTAATGFTLASFTTNVASRQYNNLELVGGASTTWAIASGATLGVAGNFSLTGSGTLTVSNSASASGLTIDGTLTQSAGNIIVSNSASAVQGTLTVTGNSTLSAGVMTLAGASAAASATGNFNTNDLSISGTGQLILDANSTTAAGIATVNGNLSITSTTANAVNFGIGTSLAGSIINVRGNMSKSGTGTIGLTGSFNTACQFVFNGTGTQTFSHSGAAQTSGGYNIAAGSTLQLLTNLTTGSNANTIPFIINGVLDAGGNAVIAGNASNTFTLASTGTIRTANASGIGSTISGFAGTNTWTAGATFHFTGTTQTAGFAAYANISSASAYNLIWAGTTSLTLDKNMTFASANLSTDGLVYLGNFNLTISAGGTLSGTFGASRMFVTDGTGTFNRVINTTGATTTAYLWPIGEMTGSANYSPVNISVGGMSNTTSGGTMGFRVVDAIEPNNGPAATYISRYWRYTAAALGTITFTNISFIYDAGDVVGTEGSLRLNSWNNTSNFWTQYTNSSAASNVVTLTSGMSSTTLLSGDNITARVDAPLYYRSVASTDWSLASTWEVSTDAAFVSPAPIAASVAPTNNNSAGIQIANGTTVGITTTVTADDLSIVSGGILSITANGLTVANGTATNDLIIASGGTLQYSSSTNNSLTISSGAAVQVNGLLRNNGAAGSPDVTNSGTITVTSTGSYEHARNAGIIPTCTWNSGSICLLTGTTNNTPTGLGQAFHHFTVNCTLGSSVNCSGLLQTINGDFSLNTGATASAFAFRLTASTTYTLNVGGNLNITNGILDLASATTTAALNVTGNTTINGSLSQFIKSGAATATGTFTGSFALNAGTLEFNSGGSSNTTFNYLGDVTWAGSVLRTNGGTHTVNFIKTSGQQDFSFTGTQGLGAIIFNVGNGTSTNSVRLTSSTWALSTSAHSIVVFNNATLNMQAGVISGTSTIFTAQTGSFLRIGHPQGITSGTTAQGNVQTNGTRTFNAGTNYIYSGIVNQVTGNGLPATVTGQVTIANTGGASNNTVTLTTTNTTVSTFNLASGLFAAGTAQNLNLASGGVVNATGGDFATGATAGRITAVGSAAFNGNSNPFEVYASGVVNFGAQTVTIQNGGVFRINSGGGVNTNAPFYGTGSTLQYASGGTYGRSSEWSTTSGRGYPHHVELLNNTTLNPANTGATQANTPMRTGGNLTIGSGSAIFMDFGGNNMNEDLIVGGSLFLSGSLSGSAALGSDIFVAGDWQNNGTAANFFPNSRAVFLNGGSLQTISGTNPSFPAFQFLVLNNSGAGASLSLSVSIQNQLTLTQGRLALNGFNLTIDPSAGITGGSAGSYIQTNGTGRLIRTVGASNVLFPVGNSAYNPITLNNSGTSDTYSVLAVDGTAPAINNATRAVQRYWDVIEGTAGGSNLTVTTQWNAPVAQAGEEGANFLRNDVSRAIGNYPVGGPWNEGAATVSGSNPYTYSASGFTTVGIFEPGMGDAFRAEPYVTSVSSYTAYTGDVIQFVGENLSSVNSITFGGVAATINTGTQTATFVEATVNAGANGSVNVINPNGTWTNTGFTYLGYITDNDGDWNTGATWRGGNVPPAGVATTINNANTVNAAVVNAPLSVTVNGARSLTFGAAGTLTATNVTMNGTGLLTLGAGGTLTIANTGTVTNNGSFSGGASGTLVFAGAGTLAGGSVITLRNFTINGGATLTNAPQILGTFLINPGGFITAAPTYGLSSVLRYNTGGTYGRNFEWSSLSGAGYPANVQISGNTTLDLGNGGLATARGISGALTVDAGSTLSTNGMSAPLTIIGAATLDGTLTLGNASAGVIIGGNLSINATGTLTLSTNIGGDVTVGGNWSRATGGTFNPNSRAVFFNGTGNQTVSGPAGGNVFPFLLLNKTAGSVVLSNDVTVSGVLTFMSSNVGNINANGFTLIVSSTSTTAIDRAGSGYVIGNLQRGIASGTNTYSFPVGSGSVYAPASMAIAGAVTTATMTVSTTGTDHPNLATSGINASLSVNRYWSVAVSGLSATTQPTFNWVSGDVDGGANFSNFLVQRRQVGAWFTTTSGTITATSAQVTGITSYGDFVVGECKTPNDYTVTGGGAYCAGGSGVALGLSGSDSWVTYQLRNNGVNVGSPVSGTGSPISFGNQTAAGSYTVIATNVGTSCTAQMSGNVTVSITSAVTPTVAITTTSTTICAGESLTFTAAPNNGGGSPTYQWRKNAINVGSGGDTYTDNGLVNGDVITVVMTTSLTCVTASTATSNALTITVGTPVNYYVDADGDGFGSNTASPVSACSTPAGFVTNNTDCDDANADRNPGADEFCSTVDEDCDGLNNEGLPVNIYYQDADGDGRGNPAVQQIYCEAPAGYVANANDCNDACSVCFVGAIEVADGFDNDCDGLTDEGFGPANDEKINALVAVQSSYGLTCTTVTGTLRGATPSIEATSGTTVTGEDVWYYFTSIDTAYSISVNTTNYNIRIELHADVAGNAAATIRDSENWVSGVGTETLNYFGIIPGQRYYVCVRNFNNAQTVNPSTASFTLCVRPLQRGGFNNGNASSSCGDPLPCFGPYSLTYNHCDVVNARFTRANQYRFEFRDVITNTTYNGLTAAGSTLLQLSQVQGLIPGRSYEVRVFSIYSTTRGDGTPDVIEVPPMFRPYIPPTSTFPAYARLDYRATITLNAHPSVQLRTVDACPTNRLLNSWVACTPTICGASNYEWRFTRVLPSAALPITVTQATQFSAWMQLGNVPGLTAGTYDVEIRPVYPGGFRGAWSSTPSCLKIVGSLMNNYDKGDELLDLEEKVLMEEQEAPVRANVFPNPTTGEVTQLLVTGYTGNAQVNIYDAAGALVYSNTHAVADGNAVKLDLQRELGQGLYNVVILAGDHQIKRKLIVMR